MSEAMLRRLAWVLIALAGACVVAAVVFDAAATKSIREGIVAAIALTVWAGVGVALTLARPRNAVGWLLLAIGVALAVSLATGAYVDWSEARSSLFPATALAALISSFMWILVIAFLIPRVMLVFPDGSIPSPRWRVVSLAQYAVLFGFVIAALEPGPLHEVEYKRYDNPVGIGPLRHLDWFEQHGKPVGVVLLVATLGPVAAVIVRFHGSRGVERQQLKWVAWAVGVTAALWVGGTFLPSGIVHDAVSLVSVICLALAPLTILVAVLRYRLYDIDAVISKTLVYGSLTVLLGGAYVGLVLAGQALTSSFAGGSNLAIAGSTLVVAALFLPVRSRVQGFVDRRFYRRRYDAQQTLEAFAARLRQQIELETLSGDLRTVVEETMQPDHASLWLREARR